MRDAIGGTVNVVIIVVFMAIVSGYLAFNVNYTKAFRVKNKIVSTYEQYEGNCGIRSECNDEIIKYMKSIGYSANQFTIEGDDWDCHDGYCVKEVVSNCKPGNENLDLRRKAYYKIVTQININIPVLNKIMPGLRIFQVSGDTKPIATGVCN